MKLSVGEMAPDFTLAGPAGMWSLSEHRGRPVVLYFYPKDGTQGCTEQACAIRDEWRVLSETGAEVVGISPDDVERHQSFVAENRLPQVLLSDPDHRVLQMFGAWREKMKDGRPVEGVVRSSIVLDEDGRVVAVFDPIAPENQVPSVLAALAGRANAHGLAPDRDRPAPQTARPRDAR